MINRRAPRFFTRLLAVLLLIGLLPAVPAQAGLISSIFKAAGKADVDAGDLRKLDIDLPTDKDTLVGKAYLDGHGEWQVRFPDKSPGTAAGGHDKVAVVIEERDLPASLDQLASLPDEYTLFIRHKQKALELQRSPEWKLRHKQVEVAIGSMEQLRTASWHMQRPWSGQRVRLVGLDAAKAPGPGARLQGAGMEDFLANPAAFRFQTVVLPGTVDKGMFRFAGDAAADLPLRKLSELASRHDINLVILGADSPRAMKRIGKQLDAQLSGNLLYDDTAEFMNRFSVDGEPLMLELNTAGEQQVLISARAYRGMEAPGDAPVPGVARPVLETTDHVITIVQIYRPDQERGEELDDRIVPWVPSQVQWYLLLSLVLGLLDWSFSLSVWYRIWPAKQRGECRNAFTHALHRLLNGLVFLVVFLPLAGSLSFAAHVVLVIYRVIRAIVRFCWKVFHLLLVRPVRFLLSLFRTGKRGD